MMQIEYITHASLLLKSENFSLLTDPCYFLEPLFSTSLFHFPPRNISKDTLGKINYVYSSHSHIDHSHPETLKQLLNQVENVILPAERQDLEERYREIGYHNIILLQNGKTLEINPGIEVTSYWDDPVDTVLVIKINDKVILHQNDCQLSTKTLKEIADKFTINYAFLLYTAFANNQPTLLYRSAEETSTVVAKDEQELLRYQIKCIRILKPQTVIPYSMTLTYCQPDQIHLNGYQRMTPPIFRDHLLVHLPELRCWVIQPGDIIDITLDQVKTAHSKNFWGENLEEFLKNITEYVAQEKNSFSRFDFGELEECQDLWEIHLKDRLLLPFMAIFKQKVITIEIVGNLKKVNYVIDIKSSQFIIVNSTAESSDQLFFIQLSIPASILKQLLLHKCQPSILYFSLYFNRIFFHLNHHKNISVKAQFGLLIQLLISLFDYDLQKQLYH